MIKDDGIRTLIPGVVLDSEVKEQEDAREYIRKKLGIPKNLQAASTTFISDYLPTRIIEKLPDEKKDEYGFTPSQNKEIEKQLTKDTSGSKGAWKRFVESNKLAEKEKPKETWNRVAGNEKRRQQQVMRSWGLEKEKQKQKEHYKKLVDFGIDNSSVKYTGTRQHLYDEWDKPEKKNPPISPTLFQDALPGKNINKIEKPYYLYNPVKGELENVNHSNFGKKSSPKEEVIIDAKHPDGFRLAEDKDLYKNYGNTPVRYIQEMTYKYDGGPAPTDSIVKKFDSFDSSTFPADPEQKKALAKYQGMYDKLSPLQKKQLDTAQKAKKIPT